MDIVVLLNWLLLLVALAGAYRHAQNLYELHRDCRDCTTAADVVLCRHYKRHESTRLVVKLGIACLAGYFLWRPLAVIDPVFGAVGPVLIRVILLAITVLLDWESKISKHDRAILSRLVGERRIVGERGGP